MWSLIGSIASSILGGGATGLLGVLIGKYFDLKSRALDLQSAKLKLDQEVQLKEIDLDITKQEGENAARVAIVQANAAIEQTDSVAFAQSFKENEIHPQTTGQSWVVVVLEFIKGLIRPLLTVYLCAISTMIYLQALGIVEKLGTGFDVNEAYKIIEMSVQTILYLTTTCVLWWFGSRSHQKAPRLR